jgi:sugar lactone lactonase YvrE
MFKKSFLVLYAVLLISWVAVVSPKVLAEHRVITGLGSPESAVVGPDGRIYVTETKEYGKYGDGIISVIEGDKAVPFAKGLNDPHGLDVWNGALYNADNRGQIWRIDMNGEVKLIVDSMAFPRKITNFNDIEIDENGNLYISDSGDWEGGGGAIFRVTQDGKVTAVLTYEEAVQLVSPNGLLIESPDKMLVVDYTTGNLHRLDLKTKSFEKINGGFGGGDGLARDAKGRLYVTDYKAGKVYVLDKPEGKPQLINVEGLVSAADIAISPDGKYLMVPDMEKGKLFFVPLPE